jgi:hypothetical protein
MAWATESVVKQTTNRNTNTVDYMDEDTDDASVAVCLRLQVSTVWTRYNA